MFIAYFACLWIYLLIVIMKIWPNQISLYYIYIYIYIYILFDDNNNNDDDDDDNDDVCILSHTICFSSSTLSHE